MFSNGREDNLYKGSKILGVPPDSIILENLATSTMENALFTKELMIKHQFQSVIVVSSNYHMRRVKSNYGKVLENTEIRLTYCASDDNHYNPKTCWSTSINRTITYTEYIKLVGNHFSFNGKEAKEMLRKII